MLILEYMRSNIWYMNNRRPFRYRYLIGHKSVKGTICACGCFRAERMSLPVPDNVAMLPFGLNIARTPLILFYFSFLS
jgi:hypothetical protein